MHAYTPWKLPDTADLSSLLLRLRQGGWRPGAAPPGERGRLTCKYTTLETVRCYVAPSNLAVWGRCVQKQRHQAGFKGRRRVDQTQPSGHSPDFDSSPPSFLPAHLLVLPPPPQIRRGGKNSCNVRTSPFCCPSPVCSSRPRDCDARLADSGWAICGWAKMVWHIADPGLGPHLACGLDPTTQTTQTT